MARAPNAGTMQKGMTGAADTQAINQLLGTAREARRRGALVEERRLVEQAVAQAPGNPLANNALGMLALEARDWQEAERCFLLATAGDPGEPTLWMNVSTARRALADAAGERESLLRVIEIDQRHFMAQLRLAEWYQRAEDAVLAARHWRNVLQMAVAIDPMPPALAQTLADARAFVTEQDVAFGAVVDAALAQARADARVRTGLENATRRFDAGADYLLGRRGIFANQCSGFHFPFLPADEFFDRACFPWFAEVEARTDAIRAEFLALQQRGADQLRPYVRQEKGTPENKWTPLNDSLDWGAVFLWEYGVKNDAVCALCPETAAALDAVPRSELPGRAPSAFFSLLKPRTRIPPHTGVTNTRAIIHLPLIVPDGCGFRVGGETRHWREGEAFAFDDTIEHEAWNDSDALRVVLIFDVWNPHLTRVEQELIADFYRAADNSGFDPRGR